MLNFLETTSHKAFKKKIKVTNPTAREVTQLLAEWRSGDVSALSELIPLVEKELLRAQ